MTITFFYLVERVLMFYVMLFSNDKVVFYGHFLLVNNNIYLQI